MDLTVITNQLVDLSGKNATMTADIATLTASNATLTADLATAKAALEAAGKPSEALVTAQADLTAATESVTTLTAENASAIEALQGVAKAVLAASGKVDAEVPKTVAELTALINDTKIKLSAALVVDGKSDGGVDDVDKTTPVANFAAFRRPGR